MPNNLASHCMSDDRDVASAEEPASAQCHPLAHEVLFAGAATESLPSRHTHLNGLLVKHVESIECAISTVGAHPDLFGFFPLQH